MQGRENVSANRKGERQTEIWISCISVKNGELKTFQLLIITFL